MSFDIEKINSLVQDIQFADGLIVFDCRQSRHKDIFELFKILKNNTFSTVSEVVEFEKFHAITLHIIPKQLEVPKGVFDVEMAAEFKNYFLDGVLFVYWGQTRVIPFFQSEADYSMWNMLFDSLKQDRPEMFSASETAMCLVDFLEYVRG